ncbi:alpha/beta hydrolase [Paraburkholderia sp. BL25I1N1]|uniref:alpha/beta hydrolase n=1 Tax=Paraburkholderia sp. BL25I1N1 TaxID=1938804 RepID=UPI000D066A00|nr:alpha/beta hydrolase [Paraburkholderia sp. BL25I1N1]PRY04449.1 acetyl esterase/lipase [Paraburkholderia sp. BL25I1N1]
MSSGETSLNVEDVVIEGHAQTISARTYRHVTDDILPIVLLFHGGGFVGGSIHDVNLAAVSIACSTRAWVISVAYSLSPTFPFPAALEDGYLSLRWAVAHAHENGADPKRIGVAGHDAGGNLATCLAAMARDRSEFRLSAQVLLAPLLDPSMTRVGDPSSLDESDHEAHLHASNYAAYFRNISQRLHPYAAPIESRRLAGLPPALIAIAGNDVLHVEAEKYCCELIAAGVPTEAVRYKEVSHNALGSDRRAIDHMVEFLRRRLEAPLPPGLG